MKHIGFAHTASLSLLLIATAGFGYAQHDDKAPGPNKQESQARPAGGQEHGPDRGQQQQQHAQPQQSPRPQQGQPQQQRPQQNRGQQQNAQPQQTPRPQQGQPQQQRPQQQMQQQQHSQLQAQQRQQQQPQQRMQPSQQRNDWQQHRATNFDSQHQSWSQRGGYQGDRIPDASFSRSFGRSHSFHVFGLPYMDMGGRPRFQYGGYWFSMMDPYPEYWGADWYQNDDMYVDYIGGGYYLYNRRFPGRPGVAISISF